MSLDFIKRSSRNSRIHLPESMSGGIPCVSSRIHENSPHCLRKRLNGDGRENPIPLAKPPVSHWPKRTYHSRICEPGQLQASAYYRAEENSIERWHVRCNRKRDAHSTLVYEAFSVGIFNLSTILTKLTRDFAFIFFFTRPRVTFPRFFLVAISTPITFFV